MTEPPRQIAVVCGRQFNRTSLYDEPGWEWGACRSCWRDALIRYRVIEYPRTRHAGKRRNTHKILADTCLCRPCQLRLIKEARMWGEYWLTDELIREVRDEINNQEKHHEQQDQEDWAVAERTCFLAGGA